MSRRSAVQLGILFYLVFLLLTPLGPFNDWVHPLSQRGYYSVTNIDPGDDTGYYAYLRSLFFDGDLDFVNERSFAHNESFTSTGYVYNNWQMGQALLFFPFFLVGHLLALLYGALGYPVSADGYSSPYYMATALASATWLLVGLVAVIHVLKRVVGERAAWWAGMCVWLGSPLVYYTFIRSRMAHTAEFFVAAILILAWLYWRRSPDLWKHFLLGGLLGLLCMVRIINVSFFVLFMVDQLLAIRWSGLRTSAEKTKAFFTQSILFAAGWGLVMLPQLWAWYRLNGVPFPTRHVDFAGKGMIEISPTLFMDRAWDLFFGAQWGLLWSMPLVVAGLLGLFMRSPWLYGLRSAILAYLVTLLGIVLVYPETSAAYGHRHFISALPLAALGLANLFAGCFARRGGGLVVPLVAGICLLAQYLMIVQYKVNLQYDDPRFTLEALGGAFNLVQDQPEALLRSTNWFRLLLLERLPAWDYQDMLFLVLFPALQLMLLVVAVGWAAGNNWFEWLAQKIQNTGKKTAGAVVALSLVLLVIVVSATPVKTAAEIQARKDYRNLMREADQLLNQGRMDDARVLLTQAIDRVPELWRPYYKISASLNNQHNLPEAIRYFDKVLEREPRHWITRYHYGKNLALMGDQERAEAMLKSSIRIWPWDIKPYELLGAVYVGQGRLENAREVFGTILFLEPDYGSAHTNLAVVYTMMNNPDRALVHLKQAVRLGVRNPTVDRLVAHYRVDIEKWVPVNDFSSQGQVQ